MLVCCATGWGSEPPALPEGNTENARPALKPKGGPASGKVKVAAGNAPLGQKIHYTLSKDEALKLVDKNIEALVGSIENAAQAGCIAIAFPEDTLGLVHWEAGHYGAEHELLEPAVGALFKAVSKKAAERSIYVIVCSDIVYPDGLRNSAVLFGRNGKEVGRYHKVHLPLGEQNKKRGDSFPVFETEELGGIGMCICYDMVFPETTRALAMGGADVVFALTVGGAAVADGAASDAAFITRAADNELYLVVSWNGGSRIIAPSGALLAQTVRGQDLTMAEFDPRAGRVFGDAVAGTSTDHRARLLGAERVPAAYAILTDSNPPLLKKLKDVKLQTPEHAARLMAEVLTVGETRFAAAEKLANDGKVAEAIAEFTAMSEHFGTTWIGHAARSRLLSLRSREKQGR